MPEVNLMFFDGSQDIGNAAPTLLTRVNGHIVLDLWEVAPNGFTVVQILTGTSPPGACEFVTKVQCSDSLSFPGQGREEVSIGGNNAPTNVNANDTPGVFMRRISTRRHYARVRIDSVKNTRFFSPVYILAIPFPFEA